MHDADVILVDMVSFYATAAAQAARSNEYSVTCGFHHVLLQTEDGVCHCSLWVAVLMSLCGMPAAHALQLLAVRVCVCCKWHCKCILA
jgi:hypothetical protein